jgi:hypothetical protein
VLDGGLSVRAGRSSGELDAWMSQKRVYEDFLNVIFGWKMALYTFSTHQTRVR